MRCLWDVAVAWKSEALLCRFHLYIDATASSKGWANADGSRACELWAPPRASGSHHHHHLVLRRVLGFSRCRYPAIPMCGGLHFFQPLRQLPCQRVAQHSSSAAFPSRRCSVSAGTNRRRFGLLQRCLHRAAQCGASGQRGGRESVAGGRVGRPRQGCGRVESCVRLCSPLAFRAVARPAEGLRGVKLHSAFSLGVDEGSSGQWVALVVAIVSNTPR
jgi:hypothetical protein